MLRHGFIRFESFKGDKRCTVQRLGDFCLCSLFFFALKLRYLRRINHTFIQFDKLSEQKLFISLSILNYPLPFMFQNKTVVITGAGSGIGRALALAFTQANANVIISDWKEENLMETQQLCEKEGKKPSAYLLDVSKREAVFEFANSVLQSAQNVDIIINNAGVSLGGNIMENVPQADFEWLMNINFWGVVYGTQAFLPHLKTRPTAWIVNISSIFGIVGMENNVPYCSAKFAVRGFTESLRMELLDFPNVIPVCVHPGGIKTNIVRFGKHENEKTANSAAKHFDKLARTTPEEAARVILKGIAQKKRKIFIGSDARIMNFLAWLLPVKYSNMLKRKM